MSLNKREFVDLLIHSLPAPTNCFIDLFSRRASGRHTQSSRKAASLVCGVKILFSLKKRLLLALYVVYRHHLWWITLGDISFNLQKHHFGPKSISHIFWPEVCVPVWRGAETLDARWWDVAIQCIVYITALTRKNKRSQCSKIYR